MKKAGAICDLQSCYLCRQCVPDWLPAIAANRENFQVRKGEMIFAEGAEVQGIYFLYRGIVKVHKRWGDDKQLILHFAKPGDILGYRGLGNDKRYPVTATALEDAIVCFVRTRFFESTLQINHQLTYSLVQFYANELQVAEQRMRNLAHMDVKGRVASMLLMLQNDFGQSESGDIDIVLSRQDMASYTGTTYETIFRMLNELVNEGSIRVAGKKIRILREDQLQVLTEY